MHQENLWATAPIPRSLAATTVFDPASDGYQLSLDLRYNHPVDGKQCHYINVALQWDELEAASLLFWTCDRYFWKNRAPRQVEREVKKRLVAYREEVISTDRQRNEFRKVDFG